MNNDASASLQDDVDAASRLSRRLLFLIEFNECKKEKEGEFESTRLGAKKCFVGISVRRSAPRFPQIWPPELKYRSILLRHTLKYHSNYNSLYIDIYIYGNPNPSFTARNNLAYHYPKVLLV